MNKRLIRPFLIALVVAAGAAITFIAVPASATTSAAGPPRPGPGPHICYQAHVSDYGWMDWACDGNMAGTTGQSKALQALRIKHWGGGSVCVTANVRGYGWQNERCGVDGQVIDAGTTGQSLPLFGLQLRITSGGICFRPHVAFYGWRSERCQTSTVTPIWVEGEDPAWCTGTWPFGCIAAPPTNFLQAVTIWRS